MNKRGLLGLIILVVLIILLIGGFTAYKALSGSESESNETFPANEEIETEVIDVNNLSYSLPETNNP